MSIDLENSKRKAAKASKFPEDVVLGMPNVEILGHSEMRIENYRGLIEYIQINSLEFRQKSVRYELPESTFKLILIQMMI